jgi:hypothetical protein
LPEVHITFLSLNRSKNYHFDRDYSSFLAAKLGAGIAGGLGVLSLTPAPPPFSAMNSTRQ